MSEPPVSLVDPTALARFGQLEVVARLIVEGYMIGQHQSPFKGSSVEFVEHRQYTPGDEIRHIDWRAFGKTGRYYIKEFEEETNLQAYLVVDASGSMAYGNSTATKYEYARVLAASLGYLLTTQRDAVGLVTFDDKIGDRFEPSTNPKRFRQLATALQERRPGGETGMSSLFEKLIPSLRRRSLVIVISDFFDDLQPLQTALQQFRRNKHEVVLLQVIAPEEADFPFEKPTQFRNLENDGQRLLVDPHRLRKVYLQQFQAFQQQLKDISAGCGCDLVQVTTSDPFQLALGHYLDWRKRRGKHGSVAR
ncbi:DUF58 domain-containing protein [Planctomicrobium piriforme]|uniref:DUF58 domain-containing protein n=1 Tax=Planctomicrobium piriforme TaxID=1576369 RepID=A0A1I3DKV4_9PLAN|nr:DUF58 domain-containing protein [Planctomicrobium piriforme]SFH87345.1 Protein of unknown function DUF58 [Planctomicrobium piriforme]